MTQFRASRFQTLSPVIKNLLIINGIVFLAQNTIGAQYINMEKWFALHTWQSPYFKPWQIVTHLFMHGDFAHIFFNMFALWMFGSVLENLWGAKRFLKFFIFRYSKSHSRL
jgi:membrane associated rhomboid family serine protease